MSLQQKPLHSRRSHAAPKCRNSDSCAPPRRSGFLQEKKLEATPQRTSRALNTGPTNALKVKLIKLITPVAASGARRVLDSGLKCLRLGSVTPRSSTRAKARAKRRRLFVALPQN